jgi:hypothetical protein
VIALLLALALAQIQPDAREGGRASMREGGRSTEKATAAPAVPYSFCAQLQAGDQVGGWGCVNGDLTAGAGSTLTWSAVGSPSTSSGITCATPSKATFSATDWVKSNNTTFPAADWSICALVDLTPIGAGNYAVWSFGNGANNAIMSQESSTVWVSYAATGGIITSLPPATLLFACETFTALTLQLYFNGVAGSNHASTFLDPGGSGWLFGSDGFTTGYRLPGPFLGGFVTEKALSGADVSRLFHAVTCS